MNSISVIVSDGEDDIIASSRSAMLKRKARDLFGSDSEEEFTDVPRTQRKRSRIDAPKIKVHKVEVIRPARPVVAVESGPSPATAESAASHQSHSAPAGSAARYFEEFCDRDYQVSTPERAVTPGLSKAELLEYDQDAQPLFDPTEEALMSNEHIFTKFPSFNILCDSAIVSTGFALQQYFSPHDKNNRLLKCAYAVVDGYSRKFLSVGLNPHKKFRPTVCLSYESAALEILDYVPMMRDLRGIKRRLVKTVGRNDRMLLTCGSLQGTLAANKQLRVSVHKINVRSLKPHEYIILSEEEIDRILESEAFIASKIKMLKEQSVDLHKKYLGLLQSCAVRIIKNKLADSMLKEHLRREILIVQDNFLNDCWWEMYIYYSYKVHFDAQTVLSHIKRKDELVV